MMILIQSRGKMKCKELAEELEVSERQIKSYKEYLEQAGIFVNSTPGIYGGYEIDKCNSLSYIRLLDNEVSILDMINSQLKYNNDIYKNEFNNIVDKIKAVLNTGEKSDTYMDYFTIQAKCNCDYGFEKKKCNEITRAYTTKRKIKIKYYSLNSGNSERVVHPYGLFNYKSDTYMVAFCEKRLKFIDFKLCRIKDYIVLDEKYIVDRNFNWNEYSKNSIGIYKGEEINIAIKIKQPFATIIREKVWVNNQQISDVDEESILFKAKMRGYEEIKSWILSMGAYVEVIEPERLKNDILSEIEKLRKLY
ncbi:MULTISPECIES: helix-turn-helix transcriptional regulator [unclassified Clostridioides]|nr:transcriptional regulator [Clostridioides sp. ES-S-0123-01]MCC0680681.1 transcriptional regulator [Clostridioides sp. ES-S-0005-03]MCC0694716.1 transcriptional regulator [Clostridioides sp. ES-S-0048-02]MCC0706350.1 transcriptional regulator [Clostridioides sp. ES-S-0190-01]MCC0762884.1 transcriptional regulator [Clostridioides sp. ES-S-0006-03]UDN49421.1 transcriptional regulator [Clostridioides sp. ES-S-0173-01]